MITTSENNAFKKNFSLNINGNIINFATPKLMGILNITPDSFYDGGSFNSIKTAILRTEKMLKEGADIIDIGAFSSKPGSEIPTEKIEKERLLPILRQIKKEFPKAIISIDTMRASVAMEAYQEGANIINDISAGNFDSNMYETISKIKTPYIMMHMKGLPKDMQVQPAYKNIVSEIYDYFHSKIQSLYSLGVNDIIIDLGFGFGKTIEHNYELLNKSSYFRSLECPILAGVSRKSMIHKFLDIDINKSLNGTTVANTIALLNGANLLRVHDVKEALQAIKIVDYMQKV